MIKLRPITINDTDNIIKWRNNPLVLKNFIQQEPLTRETHLRWLSDYIETGKVKQFIIIDEDSGLDLGSIFLRDIDQRNKKAELGIFIGEDDHRGRGIGKHAIQQLLNYAFSELKLHKIFLRVLSENRQAINSYLKAGFSIDGVFKQDVIIDDCYHDITFMSVINDED